MLQSKRHLSPAVVKTIKPEPSEERRDLPKEVSEETQRIRCQIGQELHDGVCQQLLGVACMLQALAAKAAREWPEGEPELRRAARAANDAIEQTKEVARDMCPEELAPVDLATALAELAERVEPAATCEFRCASMPKIANPTIALHCFRIAQEAVRNAVKHSGAKKISIQLEEVDSHLRLRVTDNGRGLALERISLGGGLGLKIMRSRAQAMGGGLTVESLARGGASVTCLIPKGAS